MRKLLSLPPNLVSSFHDVTGLSREEYFCVSDPVGAKLGSGGGTAWLLDACRADEGAAAQPLGEWLAREKRILLHAGGQSRRLPAYAASGKVLAPVPVFRWARGQKIDQTLLDLQMPLYERILEQAPASLRTLIASGDICLRAAEPLQPVPEADIVCYGLWTTPEQASHHGVFLMRRDTPSVLDFMLQKPSLQQQADLSQTHLALMDIGVWLLSDRAVECLCRKCAAGGKIGNYDLYGEFGCALGAAPSRPDAEVQGLSVAILPLPGGEFYHFGTSPELLSSTAALQNVVKDQRIILQKEVRRQSVFTQNCVMANRPGEENSDLWIENAELGAGWTLTRQNIVTGVPANDWVVTLAPGHCLDMAPVGEKAFALRPYGYSDPSRGDLHDSSTLYLGRSVAEWLDRHGLVAEDFDRADDIQSAPLFPVSEDLDLLGRLLDWIISDAPDAALRDVYLATPRLSADAISDTCNLRRLAASRRALQSRNLCTLAANWRKSVFYQTDLKDMAAKYVAAGLELPAALGDEAGLMTRIHDAMFRSEALRGRDAEVSARCGDAAFALLREGLTGDALRHKVSPRTTTAADQIVWARSSVRIDVAGGWTDTPPYSLLSGGNVVNLAIEMNGQPPLQVYVKPSAGDYAIICRSIDLGAMERIETYEELATYNKVGSPFSIPKAALTLCGFLPGFSAESYPTLRSQLEAFGSGIEITLLAAIPAGSGLGTSSILASTVLGALNNFCGLGWDKHEICSRTLILEQLLTTGGGWQDQYGGVFEGVKLLQTGAGFDQSASVRWLPEKLFRDADLRPCHLLYYTGITRTAKHILAEIVRGMFLNSGRHLSLLGEMKQHALAMFDILQTGDLESYGSLLRTTWQQNKALDAGTAPPVIEELCRRIDDLCLGYKLPGAGGGGFMYMVAKDAEAARRIVGLLTENPLAPTARFVDMTLSSTGLQVSRS